jgi:hypothetical protein
LLFGQSFILNAKKELTMSAKNKSEGTLKVCQPITATEYETGMRFMKFPQAFLPSVENGEPIIDEDGTITIPKYKVTSLYNKLKSNSKLAYMLLLDRLSLSRLNGWINEQGEYYIIYTLEQLAESLDCSVNTAVTLKNELVQYGLLKLHKRGDKKADIMYVGHIDATEIKRELIQKESLEKNKNSKEENQSPKEKVAPKNWESVEVNDIEGLSDSQNLGVPTPKNWEQSRLTSIHTDSIIDTHRYSSLEDLPLDYSSCVNRSFLTEKTILSLALFGIKEFKNYMDIIFRTKKKIEQEHKMQIEKVLPLTLKLNGELWAKDLEKEVQRLIYQIRSKKDTEKSIRNPEAYFQTMMTHFWKLAYLAEMNDQFVTTNQTLWSIQEVGESLMEKRYPEKVVDIDLNDWIKQVDAAIDSGREPEQNNYGSLFDPETFRT